MPDQSRSQLLARRYWDRVRDEMRRRKRDVIAAWSTEGPSVLNFIDYYVRTPGTLPEKMVFNVLVQRGIDFWYGYYFGDMPITMDKEEHYRPDFVIPSVGVIIEVQGLYWHSRQGQWQRDYTRALLLTALGYKVYTITDQDVLTNVYGAIDQIPELRGATVGGKYKIAKDLPNASAALQAKQREWPKSTLVRPKAVKGARRRIALSSFKPGVRVSRVEGQFTKAGPVFSGSDLSIEAIASAQKWTQDWLKYMRALDKFFEEWGWKAIEKYKTEYFYWRKFKDWWNKYGRVGRL